jgi:hypothetical protein
MKEAVATGNPQRADAARELYAQARDALRALKSQSMDVERMLYRLRRDSRRS